MKSLLFTFTKSYGRVCHTRYSSFKHTRSTYRGFETYAQATVPTLDPSVTATSFKDLGLRPLIISALHSAFPNIKNPTETQAKFIPAILSGKDVLLKDETGSGKSFGLILALLNEPQIFSKERKSRDTYITSLLLVPHRDLAYQFYHWIEKLVAASLSQPLPEMMTLAQVLVRDGATHLTDGLRNLHQVPPHILIGTPQAVMDVYKKDPQALQLSHLSTVVVDEVDYLIETVPKKNPNKSFHKSTAKATKKLSAHPGITRELLDIIFAKRKEMNERRRNESGVIEHQQRSVIVDDSRTSSGSPQLILSSATLRRHLNNYLFDESGWLNTDQLAKVKGTQKLSGIRSSAGKYLHDGLGGRHISHSVLQISDNDIQNIAGAIAPAAIPHNEDLQPIDAETLFPSLTVLEPIQNSGELVENYAGKASPFNPNALEAIATAFALDVPSIALLVLPSSSSVKRAVYELRGLGINSHALDLLVGEKGRSHLLHGDGAREDNPTLLVSTLATTRGLDLPELTHVFILGIPEGPKVTGRAVDAYVHLAGRVGRFGRGGKVVTIVEKANDEGGRTEEHRGKISEGAKMVRILDTINEKAVRFEHFD